MEYEVSKKIIKYLENGDIDRLIKFIYPYSKSEVNIMREYYQKELHYSGHFILDTFKKWYKSKVNKIQKKIDICNEYNLDVRSDIYKKLYLGSNNLSGESQDDYNRKVDIANNELQKLDDIRNDILKFYEPLLNNLSISAERYKNNKEFMNLEDLCFFLQENKDNLISLNQGSSKFDEFKCMTNDQIIKYIDNKIKMHDKGIKYSSKIDGYTTKYSNFLNDAYSKTLKDKFERRGITIGERTIVAAGSTGIVLGLVGTSTAILVILTIIIAIVVTVYAVRASNKENQKI